MSFSDFIGNPTTVAQLRRMLASGRLPHSLILSGGEGSGKYTLALMTAQAMLCLAPPAGELPDFCGRCENCRRLADCYDLEARVAEAMEARENLRESDKRETRILVQAHPDVLIIPPDPPQLKIKVDQVRRLIETIYLRPQGKRRIYIFTASDFMKEAANALLKALEEPPEYAVIFLLANNPGELLPTIRSRCVALRLAPLRIQEMEQLLAVRRSEFKPAERTLVARLAGGSVGRAIAFDLAAYAALRRDAFTLLQAAQGSNDHSMLFKATESYRAGAENRIEELLRILMLLLEDVLYMKSGSLELLRNTDLRGEIERLAAAVDFRWIDAAAARAAELESSLRRNVLRPLALDALATSLEA